MENIRTLRLRILEQRLGIIAGELTQVQFYARSAQPQWRPSLNVYRCRHSIIICVEMAGIVRADIELRVEPLRVWIAGRRATPTPPEAHGELLQILAMEINDGRYEREILLPEEVVPDEAKAEQRNGLLWIDLPLRFSRLP